MYVICIFMLLNIPYSIKLQILTRPSNVYKKTRRHPLFQSPFTPTFPARLKPFRYINLLYLMLWKQILEMDTTDVLAFSPSVYADTEKQYDDASATGFVILAASKGDKFQIICPMAGQGAFYSTKINGRTSFSGYRIA